MLTIPSKGFQRSVDVHNVDRAICSDWFEASVLFKDESISGADVVDLLRENEVYESQDFAWELVNDIFGRVQQRSRFLGDGYPFELRRATRLQRRGSWEEYAPYSFCLALSLAPIFPEWARRFGTDYTEQGELFESLTAESIRASLAGWQTYPTGWTRTAPRKLSEVVSKVASLLGEATGELVRWSRAKANEAGLDILCYRPFPDGRVGVPAYLVQCASGAKWDDKLRTPDLQIWTKIVIFASEPKKALSTPFALTEDTFTYSCNIVNGLLLDRHRLLAPGQPSKNWVSAELENRLIAWTQPRIAVLSTLT
jgi:hypothetical protein